jgi:hypothetical protein
MLIPRTSSSPPHSATPELLQLLNSAFFLFLICLWSRM